jgi:hypothetical protein
MGTLYNLVGRLFFSRQPDWQRQRSARIYFWVALFSTSFALILVAGMRILANH